MKGMPAKTTGSFLPCLFNLPTRFYMPINGFIAHICNNASLIDKTYSFRKYCLDLKKYLRKRVHNNKLQ
jgi:hypothetical protein